jgi:hypothetical protein
MQALDSALTWTMPGPSPDFALYVKLGRDVHDVDNALKGLVSCLSAIGHHLWSIRLLPCVAVRPWSLENVPIGHLPGSSLVHAMNG